MTAEEAVDDIILRGVSELRKNAFGDDAEDAKSLQWTREQAWILMKQLSKQTEVSVASKFAVSELTILMSCHRFHIMRSYWSTPSRATRLHFGIWNTLN